MSESILRMSQPDSSKKQKDHRKSVQPRYEFKIDKEDLNEDIADITNPLDIFAQFAADEHTQCSDQEVLVRDMSLEEKRQESVARKISLFEKMRNNNPSLFSSLPTK